LEKKVKSIIWTIPAKTDLQKIYSFLTEVSEIIADKQIERILNKTEHLITGFKAIGQKEPLLNEMKFIYRYLVQDNYKIIYRYTEDEIIVIRVFDTRQNPLKIKRFKR